MIIKCSDGCKKEVHIKKTTVTKLQDGIQRHGIICPECEHEYVSHYTNIEIRRLQNKIRKVTGPAWDKLFKEIGEKMKQLRSEIEGKQEKPEAAAEFDSNPVHTSDEVSNEIVADKQQ